LVAGQPAELGGAPVGPQRAAEASSDAANRAWAQGLRPAVRQLVDDVTAARARHTADARAALEAVTRAQASYERYEKKFGVALVAFKRGVAAAQKAEQELRDAASVIANFALARGLPELDAASKHVSTVLGWVAKAATVATAAGVAPAKAAPGPLAPTPSGGPPSSTDIGVGGRVDWKALLETTHGAFRGYVEGSATLDALGATAASSERFLSEVAEGAHASDDAATLPAGVVASALAAAGPAVAARLAAVTGTDVSGPAARFADGAAVALDGLSVQRIEQDIAITWIASLTEAQRDEIDTADSYLKSIGVIDAKHNRLGYDTGAVTLDTDERIIHVRAQVEQMAMAAVGTGEWMGRTGGVGHVRDRNGTQWPAELTQPMPEQAGGAVLLTGYRWNAPTSAEGNWWKAPGTDAELRTALIGHCVFSFQPLGPAGGGADDGPAVEPGRGDPATAPTNPAWHRRRARRGRGQRSGCATAPSAACEGRQWLARSSGCARMLRMRRGLIERAKKRPSSEPARSSSRTPRTPPASHRLRTSAASAVPWRGSRSPAPPVAARSAGPATSGNASHARRAPALPGQP
jgi:hypothetical protein